MALPTRDNWEPKVISDTTNNNSNKSFTVPAGQQYHIMSVYVKYMSTSTAGDRRVTVQVKDASNTVVDESRSKAVQAASKTYYYSFSPGAENMSSAVGDEFISAHIPPTWILSPGESVNVLDKGAVDVSADDMYVWMRVLARPV